MIGAESKSRDLANRMAGWFFLATGIVLIAFAFVPAPLSQVVAWSIGLLGAVAFALVAFAPRPARVAALDGVVSFFLAF